MSLHVRTVTGTCVWQKLKACKKKPKKQKPTPPHNKDVWGHETELT